MFNQQINNNFNPLNLNYKRIYNLIKKINIKYHSEFWIYKGTKASLTFTNKEKFKIIYYSDKLPYKNKISVKDANNNIIISLLLTVQNSRIVFLPIPNLKNNWELISNYNKISITSLLKFIENYLYYDDYDNLDARMEGLIVSKK